MKKNRFGLIALFIVLLYGCSELNNNANEQDTLKNGSVIIKLTDAPFPSTLVDSVLVTIDWVKLKKVAEESDDEMAMDSFITLEVDTTVDLLALNNGISLVLGELDDVPNGEYKEIRMHVSSVTVYVNDDDDDETESKEMDITIPSGTSSGLKIKIAPALVVGDVDPAVVMLDFDVSRSFLVKGNPKNGHPITGFKFKPVIRAVNKLETGDIMGTVMDTTNNADTMMVGAQIYLIETGSDTIASAISNEEGFYKIIGIPTGAYSLSCGVATRDTIDKDVVIEFQTTTEQNFEF